MEDSGSGPHRPRQLIHRPSIWVSLAIVALIPLVVAVVISSTVVLTQVSSRRQAVSARQSSLVLDSLLRFLDHSRKEAGRDFFHRRPHAKNRVLHHVRIEDLPKLVF